MTFVVTENCIKCKYMDCVEVCPVDCFHEGPNFLAIDPDELLPLTDDELAERLGWMPKPVRRLKSNACPMIMPIEDAPTICTARDLGDGEISRRAEYLRDHPEIRERLIRVFRGTLKQRQPSPHMEERLYDGFFPREGDVPLFVEH